MTGCRAWFAVSILIAVALLACGDAVEEQASEGEVAGGEPAADRLAPLFDDLGSYHRPITTDSELAQRYFDQGLMLTYGFNHAEAVRSFTAAAQLDSDCAMCYWGQALALGPNINAPMDESAVSKAWEALEQATRLAGGGTEVEQALIGALGKRYAPQPPEDRSGLDEAYSIAMRQVAQDFPHDAEVQTLFAEALMDTTPWDYWLEGGEPKQETREVLAAIESVLEDHPDHAGALHLYIHTVEASSSPQRAEAAADRLGTLAPGAGHLVHMPSHIYLRVGRYEDASRANELAAAADEAYIASCNAQGFYPALYYPHNIHFLWFSSAIEGRSATSIEAGLKVAANVSRQQVAEFPALENFLPIPLFSLVRFGRWDEILEQDRPPSELYYLSAMWHYARGLAQVAKGDLEEAASELLALGDFAAREQVKALEMGDRFWPGAALVVIASEILTGEIAGLEGDGVGRVASLRQAVELQDSLPYMEPPYWYYPVRQSLGTALLEVGDAGAAEAVYREDLELTPRNGWSLFGLRQSLEAQGRSEEAAEVAARFEQVWSRADIELESSRF